MDLNENLTCEFFKRQKKSLSTSLVYAALPHQAKYLLHSHRGFALDALPVNPNPLDRKVDDPQHH